MATRVSRLPQAVKCSSKYMYMDFPRAHINNCCLQNRFQHTFVQKETGRKKLIILGTGWGGYAVLRNINKEKFDVVVVSVRNHFLFTPLLASTSVGTLEFRSVIEPIRNIGFRYNEDFHYSRARKLDASSKTLYCQSILKPELVYPLKYDHLIIAVGALSNTFGVPGVEENAFYLKEVNDARNIRNRLIRNLELACHAYLSEEEVQRLLHIVIVGGGPTGVEFGAELYDFVRQDVSRAYHGTEEKVQVTLVEASKILRSFDKRLQKYAEKKFRARKNFNLIQSSVTDVRANGVSLSDGTSIPCGLVVWSTGLAPRYFTRAVDLPKNTAGQFETDKHLRVLNTEPDTVYAIGDCAEIKEDPLPCTAQVAEKQGIYLAKKLNGEKDERAEPFLFKNLGMLAYIGNYEALTDLPDFKVKGYPSWFLWRSAYLTRLGSWRLRLQVPFDWIKTFLFGRDLSRF